MGLHLVKRGTGFAIVSREPGPYSHSEPTETDVLVLTKDDMDQFDKDMRDEPVAPQPPVVAPVAPVIHAAVEKIAAPDSPPKGA